MSIQTAKWVKSTRCDSNHCVEVADLGTVKGLRDSKDPGVHLTFGADQWGTFISGVQRGQFSR
jgi:hypothetical protein